MSDSVQPCQRNLYQEKFAHLQYRDGRGVQYGEQLRELSWPIPSDVPEHTQPSKMAMGMSPGAAMSSGSVSFIDTHGAFPLRSSGQYGQPVHDRLAMPSKSYTRPVSRNAGSQTELQADRAFGNGQFGEAAHLYSQGIHHGASPYGLEKRCAALAHMGKYKEALADAQTILRMEPAKAKSRLRVKDLEAFLNVQKESTTGYGTAHLTLLCNLTPKELKMWRSLPPSVYRGPVR